VVDVDNSALTIDLAPLEETADAFAQLRGQGWTTTDGVGSVAAAMDPAPDPAAALRQLTGLLPAALNVEAVGSLSGSRRLVVKLSDGIPEVLENLLGDPRELFDERSAQDDAVAAGNDNAAAALRLPLEWRVHGTFSLAKLVDLPDGVELAVSLAVSTITEHVLGVDAATVDLLATRGRRTVLVALDAQEHALFGSVALAGIPSSAVDMTIQLKALKLLKGEESADPPPPAALLPQPGHSVPAVWQSAADHLGILAAQLLWRAIATSEKINEEQVTLTFHGYKKSSFDLPAAASWHPSQVDEAMQLRAWALYDASPDRLLALRQVVSLYDSSAGPFEHAADVQASAEVIYNGLRTEAVVEAVKSSREAHAQAQDAARQTVKNATDMVKGAVERMLASLVAVGAVLMANAGRVLPDDIGRLLVLLIAGFLLLLAASSVLLEGPLLALPAKKLKEDLDHQAGLLTDTQRTKIDQLPSLVSARCRTNTVRWVVPLVLTFFAVVLFFYGHPGRYN
jgi:hypothetical protein